MNMFSVMFSELVQQHGANGKNTALQKRKDSVRLQRLQQRIPCQFVDRNGQRQIMIMPRRKKFVKLDNVDVLVKYLLLARLNIHFYIL